MTSEISVPYLLSFDVGGTNIKWQVLDLQLRPLTKIQELPAQSDQDAGEIIARFCRIIVQSTPNSILPIALCFGFPGPFDYQRGICLMQGLSKYESLYGLNFADLLRDGLCKTQPSRDWPSVPFLFENDATCFGLGEYHALLASNGPESSIRRLACLTMGTGLGSAFIADGVAVRGQTGIPPSGMIYDQIFEGKLIDDTFSRRGIISLARESGISEKAAPDVRELATLAHQGDLATIDLFFQFGARLARALSPFLDPFQADRIVLGGKIALSLPLFLPGIASVRPSWEPIIRISERGSESAIIGAATLYTVGSA